MPWKFRICIDGKWLDSETHFDTYGQAIEAMSELVVMLAQSDVMTTASVFQLERRGNPR